MVLVPVLKHAVTAKSHFDEGRYDDAVGACRLAIDAMFKSLAADGAEAASAAYLTSAIPQEQAKEYAKLLGALKQVTNNPHHISSVAHQYWRAEALFAVQTVQHFLALAGSLTAGRSKRP